MNKKILIIYCLVIHIKNPSLIKKMLEIFVFNQKKNFICYTLKYRFELVIKLIANKYY